MGMRGASSTAEWHSAALGAGRAWSELLTRARSASAQRCLRGHLCRQTSGGQSARRREHVTASCPRLPARPSATSPGGPRLLVMPLLLLGGISVLPGVGCAPAGGVRRCRRGSGPRPLPPEGASSLCCGSLSGGRQYVRGTADPALLWKVLTDLLREKVPKVFLMLNGYS